MITRDAPRSRTDTAGERRSASLGHARLRSDGPAFARRLIESAGADDVPEASLLRIAEALNLPSEALRDPAPGTARAAAPRSVAGLSAAGLVGAIVAAAWLGLSVERRHRAEPPAPDVALSESAAQPSAPTLSEPRQLLESPAAEPRPRAAPVPRPSTPRRTRAAAAPPRDLRAELEALEAVQSALRTQRTSAAARLLEDYSRRFPDGELMLEGELLRVEVALGRGDSARALAVTERLLARPDMERYRARLEALKRTAEERREHLGRAAGAVAPARAEKAGAQGAKRAPLHMAVEEETQ